MNKWLNKIICGDNVKVMFEMPDSCIDLIVTSPPYDNLRDYKGYSFDFESCAKQIYRILKDGGVCVWVVGDATIKGSETGTSFRQALFFKDIGLSLHDTMIYEKINPMPVALNGNRYANSFEYCFVVSKGPPFTTNLITTTTTTTRRGYRYNTDGSTSDMIGDVNEKKVLNNIWGYYCGAFSNKDDKNKHPATFPEKLAQDHIISWSNEGDIVLDPFNGSGTTCKMAYRQRRKYIGIDISKEYCEIAEQRLRDERAQLNLFDT